MMAWVVARVHLPPPRPGGEARSAVELRLGEAGFEVYCPRVKTRAFGKTRISALFPGYLFVAVIDQWWSARWSPGVIDLCGLKAHGRPDRLPDGVIEALRRKEIGGFVRLEPPPSALRKGRQVRVLSGQFRDYLGVYEGQSSREREIVLLDLLGRKARVELGRTDRIEAVA